MPEHSRKFGPMSEDHPAVGTECAACRQEFLAGDWTCLVPLGPGDDPEARRAAWADRVYTGVAAHCHWACVTGEEN